MSYTEEELIKLYWWPFPPPERELGWMYDFEALKHWVELTQGSAVSANRASYVALSAGTVINQSMALKSVADATGEEAIFAANRSRLQSFVDGLVASPVVCEPVSEPLRGIVVFGVFIPFLPIPVPVPDDWEEPLSALDLTAVGVRLRAAGETLEEGPLRADFLAAATRLFETAGSRKTT
jgi:hypothetical protein